MVALSPFGTARNKQASCCFRSRTPCSLPTSRVAERELHTTFRPRQWHTSSAVSLLGARDHTEAHIDIAFTHSSCLLGTQDDNRTRFDTMAREHTSASRYRLHHLSASFGGLYPNGAPERAVSTTAWHSSGAPGNPTARAPTHGGVAPCAVFLRVLAPTQMRTARVLPQGGRPQSYLRRRHTQHCSWEEETRWDTEVHTHEMSNLSTGVSHTLSWQTRCCLGHRPD